MRVKLQLVMCSDEGQEETVTDVITLNKNSQRIEHLGLTMTEAKQLLSTLQQHLLQQQVDTFLDRVFHLRGLWCPTQGESPRQPLVSHLIWHL